MDELTKTKDYILSCIRQNLTETAIQIYKTNFGTNDKILSLEMKFNALKEDKINIENKEFRTETDKINQALIQLLNKQNFDMQNNSNEEIFISYGWGGDSEKIADTIYATFHEKKFKIIRDKIDLSYKGNIKDFMQKIGEGSYIIVIIGDKYLKSENCMFEMLEIKNNGQIYDRIFPIVMADAKIYDEIDRIDYLNYWDNKTAELQQKIKTIQNPVGIGKVIEKINQYNDIRRIIDDITDMLRNMNTLTLTMHTESNYEYIIKSIEHNLKTN
jgi:TIR domain